jgi:protein ImuA
MVALQKADIISGLQTDILRMQGFKPASSLVSDHGLGSIAEAFPNRSFSTGAVHEFLSGNIESTAATIGFTSGILSSLMGTKGCALWISTSRKVFPPALHNYGINPQHIIFLDLQKEKDVLWAMDEALKCSAITSVVGEIREITFNESRRLQLAVEQSKATGFILRSNYKKLHTTACVSRWKISQLPSEPIENLPGIGFPKWKVELVRMRNGKSGVWNVEWRNGRFHNIQKFDESVGVEKRWGEKRKVG